MTDNLQAAERFYRALASQDLDEIFAALAADFRGHVSEGMPGGLGGTYEGAEAMLRRCWAPIFSVLDFVPIPDELLVTDDERVVALGRYVGTARADGRRFSAAFAHVLRFESGRIRELVQITDTARWNEVFDVRR